MLHIDSRYIHLLAPRLEKFKVKSPTLFNMKCPFCEAGTPGRKARGFVYEREGKLFFYCHKCGESMGMTRFMKRVDPTLYVEYVRDVLIESPTKLDFEMPRPDPVREFNPSGLKSLCGLQDAHPARAFLRDRRLPASAIDRLSYADDFWAWARSMHPDKYLTNKTEGRVVIPFKNARGNYVGFQGRALGKSDVKYVTIINKPDEPYLYGLDVVNFDAVTIALEGPIDAMFLENAVASGGGDVTRELERAGASRDNTIIVYDNERRSPATAKKMLDAATRGWRVCVWPESIKEKDVNDMIKSGMSAERVRSIILESARGGASALAAIHGWVRCVVA